MIKKTLLIMTSALIISSSSNVQAGLLDKVKSVGGKVGTKTKGVVDSLENKGQIAYNSVSKVGTKIEQGSQKLKDTSTKVNKKVDDLQKRSTRVVNNVSDAGLNTSKTIKSTANTVKKNATMTRNTVKTMGSDIKEIWDPRK